MATWEVKPFDITQINEGQKYEDGNIPNAEAVDAAIEGAAYAQAYVTALTSPPDLTEAGNIGTPSVSFVANGDYYKFKFSNLKGATGEKGNTGASISDINFIYASETSTETIYNVQTVLDDGTTVDSGQISIPKTTVPKIAEFASAGTTTPSADLMVGGLLFTEV